MSSTIEDRLAALEQRAAEAEQRAAEAERRADASDAALIKRVTRTPSGIACQVDPAETEAAWIRTHRADDPFPGPCQATKGSDNAYAHLDLWANAPTEPPEPGAKRTRKSRRAPRIGHQYLPPEYANINDKTRQFRGSLIAQSLAAREMSR